MASKTKIRKMDKVFGAYIRSLGHCEWCGKSGTICQLQWCHIFSRKFHSTRWSKNNSLCMCAGCHFKGHNEPIIFVEWLKEYLGEDGYDKLMLEHNTIKKWKDWELDELISKYKNLTYNGK